MGLISRNSRSWKQLAQRRHHHQRIDERVHAIEDPTTPGCQEAAPLVWSQGNMNHPASFESFAFRVQCSRAAPRTRRAPESTNTLSFAAVTLYRFSIRTNLT